MDRKGITKTMVIVIFSIICLMIVITVVAVKFWPWIRFGIFSPCWASFTTKLNTLSGPDFLRKPQKITIGDCVNGLYFFNKNELESFMEEKGAGLDCNEKGKGFIAGTPYFPETESGWNIFKLPKDVWENVVRYWKRNLGGVEAVCKSLDKPFNINGIEAREGPGTGETKAFCIRIKKSGDGKRYELDIEELEKDEECEE